ncbi:hypothetical protein BH10BDE1_BH10BDE1_22450 [soil metagenome]
MASKLKTGFGVAIFGGLAAALITGITLHSHYEPNAVSEESHLAVQASLTPLSTLPLVSSTKSAPSAKPVREPASKPMATLNEILSAHADNDPRLDTELLHLDAPTKRLFRERYASIAREEQNDRGTIIFLLGRNIVDAEDVQFLVSVLSETPCLSLENCGTPPARTNAREAPSDMALAYSQAVSIVSFERFLTANPSSKLRGSILESLQGAKHSSSSTISRLSEKALSKFQR